MSSEINDVFISYKVEDAAHVRAAVNQLILSGLKVWFDEDEILLADDQQLDEKLKDAINHSEYAAVFISPGYQVSEPCVLEKKTIHKIFDKRHIIEIDLSKHLTESRLGVQMLPAKDLNDVLEDIESVMGCSLKKVTIEDEDEEYFEDEWSGHPYHFNATGWHVTPNQCQLVKKVNGNDVIMSLQIHALDDTKIMNDLRMRKQNHRIYQGEIKEQNSMMLKRINAKCLSIHMITTGDFIQHGISYQSSPTTYERMYQLFLPQPDEPGVTLFMFIFTLEGTRETILLASRFMDRIVASFRWPARQSDRAHELVNQAFTMVNNENFKVAIKFLKEAIRLKPELGDAYNELAFVYAKTVKINRAIKYARKAADAEPDNPKFYSNYLSYKLEKLKRKKHSHKRQLPLCALIDMIDEFGICCYPPYPPFHAIRAQALALLGNSENVWMDEIGEMKRAYEQQDEWGSGVIFDDNNKSPEIENMMNNVIKDCYSLQQMT